MRRGRNPTSLSLGMFKLCVFDFIHTSHTLKRVYILPRKRGFEKVIVTVIVSVTPYENLA